MSGDWQIEYKASQQIIWLSNLPACWITTYRSLLKHSGYAHKNFLKMYFVVSLLTPLLKFQPVTLLLPWWDRNF